MKRSVRFVRALALSCAAVSCAGKVTEETGADAANETGVDAKVEDTSVDTAVEETRVDAPMEETVVLPKNGMCLGPTGSKIDCAGGGSCVWDVMNGWPTCRFDTIGTAPCGPIGCGMDCACTAYAVCTCNGPVAGPLAPPDLASV